MNDAGAVSTPSTGADPAPHFPFVMDDSDALPARFGADATEHDVIVPEPGRYRLLAPFASPRAHRPLITRRLLGLEPAISLGLPGPLTVCDAWTFHLDPGGVDPVLGIARVEDAYPPGRSGSPAHPRVPALADTRTGLVVMDNADALTLGMVTEWEAFHRPGAPQLYPPDLRDRIDHTLALLHFEIATGVLRCARATDQADYDHAYARLWTALDWIEARLGRQRYLVGDTLTLADVYVFPTLVRFDAVYHTLFRCNRNKITEMPALWGYARDLFQTPGFGDTVDFGQIMQYFYLASPHLNPSGIVPRGPEQGVWLTDHGRHEVGGRPFGEGTPPGPVPEDERASAVEPVTRPY